MKRTAVVVGLGDISALHLGAITQNPDIELVGVCDIRQDRAETASQTYAVPYFLNHRDMLAELRPDVVHVTTPHDQHVPIAMDALDAGSHVLTEKPVAHNLAAGHALASRARTATTKVAVCFQNRYNPTSVAMKGMLDSGQLGAILGVRGAVWWNRTSAYYAASPWRGTWSEGGGGVLINQSIHTLDLMQWVLGGVASFRGVASTLALQDAIEVEDTAAIVVTSPTGVRGTFFATNAHHANAPVEFEVTCERGTLSIANAQLHLTRPDGHSTTLASDLQASGERSYWGKSHELLINDFYARLDDVEPFWIDPTEAMIALTILRNVYVQSGLIPEA